MDIITVDHLTQDYGHGRGVFDVNFSIREGEVFGFLGPNGAGKSTTIRHIMGFSRPQKGETRVFNLESFHNYHKILSNVGYLPGEIALPEGLTGWEFIKMMGDLRKTKDKERLIYLLKKFDLNPAVATKSMSLGEKRKLAIVVAFMDDPEVLILDEPTSGLDPVMQQVFIEFVKEEKKRGKTILLSSHMFNEVEATCDRIAIIKDGRIVTIFNTNFIKHNENKVYDVRFESEKDLDEFIKNFPKAKMKDDLVKKFGVKDVFKKKLSVHVAVNDSEVNDFVAEIAKYKIKSFAELKLTLEDYFMTFYKEDKNYGGMLWKK